MEFKTYTLGVKQVHEGKVLATLARLSVRDRDGDILRNGLLKGRQLVAIKPQHKWDHVDLGVADVYETNNTLEAAMEFNLAIPSAKDWFEALRFSHEKGRRQQYSFGFEVLDFEHGEHEGKSARFLNHIAVAECSPVLIGASIGSETLSVKAAKRWPGLEVTRMSHPKTELTQAVTSHRTTRRQLLKAIDLLERDASPLQTARALLALNEGLDALDVGSAHQDNAIDALNQEPPPVVTDAPPVRVIASEVPVIATVAAEEDETMSQGEKGGQRPINEQVDEVMQDVTKTVERLEAIKRLRETPSERYPHGRPMSPERLQQAEDLIVRLSRLKATGAEVVQHNAAQQELQAMAERFKELGVAL